MHDPSDPHHNHPADDRPAHGHNAHPHGPAQWQTPHLPQGDHTHDPPKPDEHRDLDLVEQAFCDGFGRASDPTSFLRLAGVRFEGAGPDGTKLVLLRVELQHMTDIGSVTPQLGGGPMRYAPLPARMTSRRDILQFIYFDGVETRRLSLDEARNLDAPVE